jgi:hypothetical protein
MTIDLANKYGWTGNLSTAEPWGRLFYFFDPYAPAADWRTLPQFAAPAGKLAASDASGMGFTFLREGNNPDSAYAELMSYNDPGVDHRLSYISDFQMYANGEWTVSHPEIYNPGPMVANTILVAGLGRMSEASGRIGYDVPADGSYAYSAATTGGNFAYDGYYGPPPTFVQEATRSMFYLPSGDANGGGAPTLVLFDRMNVDPPNPNGNWYATDWQTVSSSPLKQLIFHSPVAPTATSSGISWQTAGGQDVQVSLLTPGLSTTVTSEANGILGGYANASELNYVTSVTPTAYQKWNTFVSVVQSSAPGYAVSNTRVTSTDGSAEGVLVQRAGQNDALVLFNATQAADLPPSQTDIYGHLVSNPNLLSTLNHNRLHEAGFTLNTHIATAAGDVYLTDLDTSKQWSVTVDGVAQALSVSAAGVAHLTINGAGNHLLSVSVAG